MMIVNYAMILISFIFILGICIGSFLNVVIDRTIEKRSILYGRSTCDYCGHVLAWYDLFPLLSFAFLKGRCRYCRKDLSWQYPIMELVTGLLFVGVFLFTSPIHSDISLVLFILQLGVFSVLLILFVTDIKYGILPDRIVIAGIILALLFVGTLAPTQLFFHIFSGLGACGFFLAIILATKGKGMGLGDAKFSLCMGLLVGFPIIVLSIYIAFLSGAMTAISLVLIKKKKFFGATMPFGPFLILGTTVGFFWGNTLMLLVQKFLGI